MTERQSALGAVRIVARYSDGRVLKGTTLNFSPTGPKFFLHLADAASGDEAVPVLLSELKGVFFVRDLTGDPAHKELKEFATPPAGRRILVTFRDGEQLMGSSLTYNAARDGFFLFPADAQSNTERVFVVMQAVLTVERL